VTLTFDLLTPKPNQFILVPRNAPLATEAVSRGKRINVCSRTLALKASNSNHSANDDAFSAVTLTAGWVTGRVA